MKCFQKVSTACLSYRLSKHWNLVEIFWAILELWHIICFRVPKRSRNFMKNRYIFAPCENCYFENQSNKLNPVKHAKLVFWLNFFYWLRPYPESFHHLQFWLHLFPALNHEQTIIAHFSSNKQHTNFFFVLCVLIRKSLSNKMACSHEGYLF